MTGITDKYFLKPKASVRVSDRERRGSFAQKLGWKIAAAARGDPPRRYSARENRKAPLTLQNAIKYKEVYCSATSASFGSFTRGKKNTMRARRSGLASFLLSFFFSFLFFLPPPLLFFNRFPEPYFRGLPRTALSEETTHIIMTLESNAKPNWLPHKLSQITGLA